MAEHSTITPEQCRAARALIGWSQDDLSDRAKVAKKTLQLFELGQRDPYDRTLAAIRSALERDGVEFIPENGGDAGVRIRRLRKGDQVRFREGSRVRLGHDIKGREIGIVTFVESHPPATGPTYRVDVQFPRDLVRGVFKYEFELVTLGAGEKGGAPKVRPAKQRGKR